MSIKRLRERVPSARFVSIATLHAHELRFHKKSVDGSGKCDAYATQNNEHAVIGVVCEIKESEFELFLDNLDNKRPYSCAIMLISH